MSKKSAILILVLVILAGTTALYFVLGGKAPSGLPIISDLPFGTPPDETPADGVGGGADSGVGTSTDTTDSDGDGIPDNIDTIIEKPVFFNISNTPVAGSVAIVRNGVVFVRYVERATGHVNEFDLTNRVSVKIINTTRPHIYKALWREDGAGFVERSVIRGTDTVTNSSVSLLPPASTSTDSLYRSRITLLEGSVGELIVGKNNSLLYNLKDTGGILTSAFDGSGAKTIYPLEFTEWRIMPVSNTGAVIFTKPSFYSLGYAYTLNLQNGSLTKIAGPARSLSVLPNSLGDRLAIGNIENNAYSLNITNTKTNRVSPIVPATLPDKCAWSKKMTNIIICGVPERISSGETPDLWYQGETSYTDKIWRFNTDTDTAEILLDPSKDFSTDVDIETLSVSPNDEYAIFINKKDLSLWGLKLPE